MENKKQKAEEEDTEDGRCHCKEPERGMGVLSLNQRGYYCKKCRKFREEENK